MSRDEDFDDFKARLDASREQYAQKKASTIAVVSKHATVDSTSKTPSTKSTRDEILAANPIVEFVRARVSALHQKGEHFITSDCPNTKHKRGHNCVTIYPATQSWACHDCKQSGSVIDWVMLEKNIGVREAMQQLSGEKGDSQIVATYDYTDENGDMLSQTCRIEPGKDGRSKNFKQRRPDGKGGYIWNRKGVRRVLYRLLEVIKAQLVIVTEGEKDADNLCDLGFTATTNPMGAGKWHKEYAETLRGKDVIVFGDVGDPDGAGEKHTAAVLKSLVGVANSLKHAIQPDGFHDVSDWIATLRQLAHGEERQTIEQLIDETPFYKAQEAEAAETKPKKEKRKKESSASQLVAFVVDQDGGQDASTGGKTFGPFSLFHDPKDRAFARYQASDHVEIWPVESSKFRRILARIYYNNTGKIINRNSLSDAVTTLSGLACYNNPKEPVYLRVAPYAEGVIIDLCDSKWRVVHVTQNGWSVLDQSPVAFVRTGSMQALPEPQAGNGSIKPLWKLLNVTKKQRVLVAGVILNAFHPFGPYFVANYVGEQGAAKTCAGTIHRQLVDPNENPLRSPPREERDLLAQAVNNWCVALDNLSYLPWWLSDALCRLATGGGHSARTLYTDLEEISIKVKRPVIINGIEDVAKRPDLADRVVQIELEQIKESHRIQESELWKRFDQERPRIFTAILDALVSALRNRNKIKFRLPRMADAAIWAAAGETALGFKPGTFIRAYRQNLGESARATLEASPVGVAIDLLLEEQEQWEGKPSELLKDLSALISEKIREQDNWPKSVRALGHCLRRIAPALRRAGIGYERPPREAKRRLIRLQKARKHAETPSETSQTSFPRAENDNSETTSSNVSKTATSSQTHEANDDDDVDDDVSHTLHFDDDESTTKPF